jgi:hypothetical protein
MPPLRSTADTRTWTCDRCGLEFPSTRKTRGGVLPSRCADCKKANPTRRPAYNSTPRSNNELIYVLARECTELRCALQEARGALATGRYFEARLILEGMVGPPPF